MAEQAAQEIGEPTSVVEPAATAPAVEAAGIEAPSIAPDHESPPKPDPVKAEAPKVEPPRIEVPKFETKPEPKPGKLIVMAPSERSWEREEFAPHVKADEPRETDGKRRLSAMAAVVAIAASVGAISGALATAGMMHFAAPAPAPAQVADTSALESSVARIDADVVALKANVEHTSKTGLSQFNRANDRLDKLEKAQAEPMAKIAKLSETVDKLRATPPRGPHAGRRRREGDHRLDRADPGCDRRRRTGSGPCRAQDRGRPVADDRWLGAARRRQWRCADRGPRRPLRGLCRRPHPRNWPRRCDPPSGRPLGRRHQQGPDRRPLSVRYPTSTEALHHHVRRLLT
ncbi:outer membrane murein-binding lipoprotein Lpp [Bradyrhizobium japonicum]